MTLTSPCALQQTSPRFRTSDPGQISSYMSSAFRPNRSTLTGGGQPVDFCHRSLVLGDTSIHQVRYGREATVEAPPVDHVFLAMFTLAGNALIDQGGGSFETAAGSICILNPARHLRIRLSGDFEQLTVKLDSGLLLRALLESGDCDLRHDLGFTSRAYDLAVHPSGFARLVDCICADMCRAGSRCETPATAPHLERALGGLLVNEFDHNYSRLLESSCRGPAPAALRRAEEFMLGRLGEPLDMEQLAHAAGCSTRSLQQAFRHFRQTTPSVWLRLRRLERARELLRDAARHHLTVTAVAYECGFTHLSKFAAHYRARFGESPLQTQKQSRLFTAGYVTARQS